MAKLKKSILGLKTMDDDKTIEKIESEISDDYADDDIYKIKSWGADMSFRELVNMYNENELIKPEIQRNYVWAKDEASRFIDSLLLGLPVPSIFLAKDRNENKLIIDGYQRIMTVYDYIRGVWSGDNSVFKLSRSEKINKRWAGKAFVELDGKEQKKIRSTTIHAIIFEQSHPREDDTSLYQIFERINTSGRSLTSQEIRNCVYQGELNKLLIELNTLTSWRKMFGTDIPDPRMRDIEFVLRFFLMLDDKIRNRTEGKMLLKKQLNIFMGDKINNSPEAIVKFRHEFSLTMDTLFSVFGKNAFKRTSHNAKLPVVAPFHPTIFDSIATCAAIYLRTHKNLPDDIIKNKLLLLADNKYSEYITNTTTKYEYIKGRFDTVNKYLFS